MKSINSLSEKLKVSWMATLALCFLIACGQNKNEDATVMRNEKPQKSPIRNGLDQQEVPQGLLTLAGHTENKVVAILKNNVPEENLYGKFFDERAEFYIIENPQNKLYGTKVNKLTLYYLDGELSQTRYILEADIVNELITLYGKFGISGHDPKNQALIEAKQVMVNTPKGQAFNKELDNYQITFKLDERQIRYRVNKHEPQNRFNYLERLTDYKQTFSQIERGRS